MDKLNNATNNIKDAISAKDVKNMNNDAVVKQKPVETSKQDTNGIEIKEPFEECFNGSNGEEREETETDSVSTFNKVFKISTCQKTPRFFTLKT